MSRSNNVELTSTPAPAHKPLHHYRFTQQRLPGWRPVLTTFYAIVVLFIGCAILLALGLVFYFLQNGYNEVRVRYDDKCKNIDQECNININIEKKIKGNLEIRYMLTKYYQNHRRYGFSRIDSQLAGDYVSFEGMSNCKPYRSHKDSPEPKDWVLPCGLFALSLFNDSFSLDNLGAKFTEKGIAFKSEIEYLYKDLNEKYTEGDQWLKNNSIFPGGSTDEHFMVWMRQAALPTVVKTYAKCDDCEIGAGEYTVKVQNRYPTTQFKGEKYFVISKVTTLGTHNIFLGIIFMVCAGVCGLYAIALLIFELVAPRKMGEPRNGSI